MDKANVDIRVEDDILKVEGKLDFSKYQGLQPVYTEYNIGHYARSFSLSSKIDQGKIGAELNDGVLSLCCRRSRKPNTHDSGDSRFAWRSSIAGRWISAIIGPVRLSALQLPISARMIRTEAMSHPPNGI